MNEFPLLPYNKIDFKELEKYDVSRVARSKRGFLTAYKEAHENGKELSEDWVKKRNSFLKRMIGNLERNMKLGNNCYRQYLSIVHGWALDPKFFDSKIKNEVCKTHK